MERCNLFQKSKQWQGSSPEPYTDTVEQLALRIIATHQLPRQEEQVLVNLLERHGANQKRSEKQMLQYKRVIK